MEVSSTYIVVGTCRIRWDPIPSHRIRKVELRSASCLFRSTAASYGARWGPRLVCGQCTSSKLWELSRCELRSFGKTTPSRPERISPPLPTPSARSRLCSTSIASIPPTWFRCTRSPARRLARTGSVGPSPTPRASAAVLKMVSRGRPLRPWRTHS